jgi:hypothetical protein
MLVYFTRIVVEERFKTLFENRMSADHFQRAVMLFRDFGCFLSHLVTNVLLWAADKDKTEEVLCILETYWHDNEIGLDTQDPKIRGLTPGLLDSYHNVMTMPVVDSRIDKFFFNTIEAGILDLTLPEGGKHERVRVYS